MTLSADDLLWLASKAPRQYGPRQAPRISAKRKRFGFFKPRKTA